MYLQSSGAGERRAGLQELLLADAHLLHVVLQQPLHLSINHSSVTHALGGAAAFNARQSRSHQLLVLLMDLRVGQLILVLIIEH